VSKSEDLDIFHLGKELEPLVPGFRVEVMQALIPKFLVTGGQIDDKKKKITIFLWEGATKEDAIAILAHEYAHLKPGTMEIESGLREVEVWRRGAQFARNWGVYGRYKYLAMEMIANYELHHPIIARGLKQWLAEENIAPMTSATGREGLCFQLAFQHVTDQEEGTLVHGKVWSPKLGQMIDHAWVITETGYVYEPVSDRYFERKSLYETYRMKEENIYTPTEARKMALRTNNYGPWSDEERQKAHREVTMRILDLRRKSAQEIQKFSTQYPPKHYRQIGTEHSQRAVTDDDIKEFQKRAKGEGAVAVFIFTYGQAAYIPVESASVVPQTIFGDDLLQYYEVPSSAF
jgi:hypothetical protein